MTPGQLVKPAKAVTEIHRESPEAHRSTPLCHDQRELVCRARAPVRECSNGEGHAMCTILLCHCLRRDAISLGTKTLYAVVMTGRGTSVCLRGFSVDLCDRFNPRSGKREE